MEMPDYKPNSNKYKKEQAELKEERRVSKVVQGNVKVKKKTEIRKFADNFISDEAENIGSYIVMDLLIPAIKNTILDIITGSAEMLFGGDRRRGGSRNRTVGDRVSYVNYADRYRERDRRPSENVRRSACDFDDIVVNSRGEAEEVLAQLDAMIETYKVARVSDLYDLVGITGPHTANRYGWTNLRNAEAVRMRDGGYLLKLPRAIPIDN